MPDLFKAGRDIVVDGQLRNGVFVAKPGTMVTKCPSKYVPKQADRSSMAELGRAALVVSLGLAVYALVAGALRGARGAGAGSPPPRRTRSSPRSARRSSPPRVLVVALVRHDFSFTYVADHTSRELPLGYTLSAFWGGQEGSLLLWLLVLTGYSAAVAVLAQPQPARDLLAWVVAGARRVAVVLRVPARRRREPVRRRSRRRPTAPGSTRACRTRTWSPTRRCSTSATSG